MTSFNHYALGAVADWLHRTVAGLAPAAPGYRRILVQPRPTRLLTHASARHRTPYGDAEAGWERANGALVVRAVVPVGATAVVQLPGDEAPIEVGHGSHEWRRPDSWGGNGAGPGLPTVRAVMDDQPAWQQVVGAATDLEVVPGEAEAAYKLKPYLDEPADTIVDALVPRGLAERGEELRERLSGLLGE
jgi:alpha-L-rhamnosidase